MSEWHMWWKHDGAKGLRRVLLDDWDPIGGSDTPDAMGEYDSYLGPVARILREGGTEADVYRYLSAVREDRIGLRPDPEADQHAAEAVVRWWRAQPPALG